MKIAIAKEIKTHEGRVAMLPEQVSILSQNHQVYVESKAGVFAGADDDDYRKAGASIVTTAKELFENGELIVKVKEILPQEFDYLRPDHIIFSNLHTASDKPQLDKLLDKKLISISAEEIHANGSPNCPLAGELGALEGLRLTLSPYGGSGIHFFSHFGAPNLKAVVIGLGAVGRGVLRTLLPLGVEVSGLDAYDKTRFTAELDWQNYKFKAYPIDKLTNLLADADMIVNCVLWDKSRNDHLITRDMLKSLKNTAVIVDISCDTQGAIETCHAVSYDDPVYLVDGIRHFCVDNIPGAVPVTASQGYANALLPKVKLIADLGIDQALQQDAWLRKGLTTYKGMLTLSEAANKQQRDYIKPDELLTMLQRND